MDPYLARLNADLSTADQFILRNAPISLEFLPSSEPRLATSPRNDATNMYLRMLYSLRNSTMTPPANAPLLFYIQMGQLHVRVVERVDRFQQFLKSCFLLFSLST